MQEIWGKRNFHNVKGKVGANSAINSYTLLRRQLDNTYAFFFFFGIHVLFDPRMNPTYLFEQQYPTCVLMENWLNELYNIQTMKCFTTMKK